MKKILLLFVALGLFSFVQAQVQQFVLEGVGTKHAVLEEFTGIKCGNCPAGHTEATNIISANPGLVHVLALPPSNSSYTNPSGTNGTDFRRPYTDAFYTSSYCSPGNGSRFMPSAFINRKLGADGNILQSRTNWSSMVTATLAETPVLNVAAKSSHNTSENKLNVDVQVYFTDNVTSNAAIYVMLTEDGLTSDYQSGSSASSSAPYVYKHTFRENISPGQWGDPITGPTTQGSLYSKTYSFDLSTAVDPIDLSKAHVVAYVIDATSSNKEVFNGIEVAALGGQASTGSAPTSVNNLNSTGNVEIYPNPSSGDLFVDIHNIQKIVSLKITNLVGKTVYQASVSNSERLRIQKSAFPSSGVYFVELNNDVSIITKKVIIQ